MSDDDGMKTNVRLFPGDKLSAVGVLQKMLEQDGANLADVIVLARAKDDSLIAYCNTEELGFLTISQALLQKFIMQRLSRVP